MKGVLEGIELSAPAIESSNLILVGQVSFRFSYLPFPVEAGSPGGEQCPTECDPDVEESCGRCIQLGNAARWSEPDKSYSRIFEVTNVEVRDSPKRDVGSMCVMVQASYQIVIVVGTPP